MPETDMSRDEVEEWLREEDESRLRDLWREADRVRGETVGDKILRRGLVEISNHCARACAYCGLRAQNISLERYRMAPEEILACAAKARDMGCDTAVLQAGEDPALSREWVADVVRSLRRRTGLVVTLSLGERGEEDLAAWRGAGAGRYLLKTETSDRRLYDAVHPPLGRRTGDRVAMLRTLKRLGYEVGGGVMVGLPGQSFASLARDVELFRELELDMIGIGPFIPHPRTPLGSGALRPPAPTDGQVPPTVLMTCKVIALARIVAPDANIPATTALATLGGAPGRELGLSRGANVVMLNVTPASLRRHYEIYPPKLLPDGRLQPLTHRSIPPA